MRQRTTEVRALIEDIKTLFDYSSWANDRLCVVLSQLTTEQFTQPVAGSYGSIRNMGGGIAPPLRTRYAAV
jgi:uncharacterized damage-inducible protein DinB